VLAEVQLISTYKSHLAELLNISEYCRRKEEWWCESYLKTRALFSQNEVPATPLSHSPHSHFTPLSSLGAPLNQPGSRAVAHGKCFKPLCVIATSRVRRKRSVCARRQTSMPPHPALDVMWLPATTRTHAPFSQPVTIPPRQLHHVRHTHIVIPADYSATGALYPF
jgi:hypothetical protein